MLLFEGRGLQLSEAQVVQLVGDCAQLALTAYAGFEAAFMAVFAQEFQLVVQVSHSVVSIGECF